MRVAPALLAALALALSGCGGGGAEPGAARAATLVLDFQPNAVHAGLYAGLERGCFAGRGLELELQEPSASTDAPKLLAAGRAELAILDVHDLALARERGLKLTALAAIVQRPLAAVIAADRGRVRTPRDLEGATVGVTGLPSDDAVLDAVLGSAGLAPDAVERVTVGFDAVAGLSSGRLDAATTFWSAEGVALRELGLRTRELRVDDYGAPRYPELIVAASERTVAQQPELVAAAREAIACGYRLAVRDPREALDALLGMVAELDRSVQRAQLRALLEASAFGTAAQAGRLDPLAIRAWARWDLERGIVEQPVDVAAVLAGSR